MDLLGNKSFILYSGIASGLYAIYAGFRYHSLNGIHLISSEQAKNMLQNNKIRTVLDVRTNSEYLLGNYPNSHNIPLQKLTTSRLKGIMKSLPILIYCNTGNRARRASELLKKMGYEHVYYIADTYKTLL